MEFWTLGSSAARTVAQAAATAEAAGFDGFAVVDSQNLAGDCYVALTIAAGATQHLRLGTAMTNPVTRHPAATAAAIASVHEASGGRATLGIGRGDSSLSQLGHGPAPVPVLERHLAALQGYLAGADVPFDALGTHMAPARGASTPAAAGGPAASRLRWLDRSLPKVPVEVAASGPKVLAAAARHADRVMLAVGADPERIAWAAEVVQAARREAGRDEGAVALGVYVHVGCHPDEHVARALIQGGLSTVARYAAMHGRLSGPMAEDDREVLTEVHRLCSVAAGPEAGLSLARALTPGFIDRFAVVGPPERCVQRLRELLAIGADKVLINSGGSPDLDATRVAARLMAEEVLPALHRSLP